MNNYEISNRYDSVNYSKFSKKYFNDLLKCSENIVERERAGQDLLDYLCDKYKISRIQLVIKNKPQLHKNRTNGSMQSKTLGKYHFKRLSNSYLGANYIEIYNVTAKIKKVVSIKTFADTLLHEFIHHYDYNVLKLSDSIHSAGFYKRISDLKNKLSE